MNIIFAATVDPTGQSGSNIATANLIIALAQHPSINLTLICPKPVGKYILPGLKPVLEHAYLLPPKKPKSALWQLSSQFYMFRALQKIASQTKDGIILTRATTSLITPPLIATRLKMPYVLWLRGIPEEITDFGSLKRRKFGTVLRWSGEWISQLNARTAATIYAADEEVKEWVYSYLPIGKEKVKVLNNAVDPTLFYPQSISEARQSLALNLSDSDFVVGFVGSIKDRHGLTQLLQAFITLKQRGFESIKLLIVGNGPLRKVLETMAAQAGLQSEVLFTGFIPHEQVSVYVSACDILYGVVDPVITSNPIKCYEYLATERPILTSVNRAFDFVETYKTGIAIQSLQSTEIAMALEQAYLLGKNELLEMGKRGRRYILEHHTWKQIADKIVDDMKKLLFQM